MSRVRWYDLTGDGAFHVSRSLQKDAFVQAKISLWQRMTGRLKSALTGAARRNDRNAPVICRAPLQNAGMQPPTRKDKR
jgi:hypothetical protein